MSLVYFLQRKKVNRYSSMQLECHLGSQNPQSQELPTVYEHGSEVKKKKKDDALFGQEMYSKHIAVIEDHIGPRIRLSPKRDCLVRPIRAVEFIYL